MGLNDKGGKNMTEIWDIIFEIVSILSILISLYTLYRIRRVERKYAQAWKL